MIGWLQRVFAPFASMGPIDGIQMENTTEDDMTKKKRLPRKKAAKTAAKPAQHTGAVELHPITGKQQPKHSEHS